VRNEQALTKLERRVSLDGGTAIAAKGTKSVGSRSTVGGSGRGRVGSRLYDFFTIFSQVWSACAIETAKLS
jgi:hypothetical protein